MPTASRPHTSDAARRRPGMWCLVLQPWARGLVGSCCAGSGVHAHTAVDGVHARVESREGVASEGPAEEEMKYS